MKKPENIRICLNSMVKNEEKTIERMLSSVVDYIDYWVIQDNGSTDNTKEIIREFFKRHNKPGFLYEEEWKFPGWNRDHTLRTCLQSDHNCQWILRMDADETLMVDDSFNWSPFLDGSIDSFNIMADAGDTKYFRTWIWNANRDWFFAHDRRHETIHMKGIGEGFQRVNLDMGFRHVITNDGQTWSDPMKFLKDALELEIDLIPSNKILDDNYHLWYLGKSYFDSLNSGAALPFGVQHLEEYARRCQFYFKMYLDKVHQWDSEPTPRRIDDMGYVAALLIGDSYQTIGNLDQANWWWTKCSDFSPSRNEGYYRLWKYCGDEYAKLMLSSPSRKNPFPNTSFLVMNYAYWDTNPELGKLVNIENVEPAETTQPFTFSATGAR